MAKPLSRIQLTNQFVKDIKYTQQLLPLGPAQSAIVINGGMVG